MIKKEKFYCALVEYDIRKDQLDNRYREMVDNAPVNAAGEVSADYILQVNAVYDECFNQLQKDLWKAVKEG